MAEIAMEIATPASVSFAGVTFARPAPPSRYTPMAASVAPTRANHT